MPHHYCMYYWWIADQTSPLPTGGSAYQPYCEYWPRLDGSADEECLTFSTGGSADHLPCMVPPAKNHILHHINIVKVLDVNTELVLVSEVPAEFRRSEAISMSKVYTSWVTIRPPTPHLLPESY